MSCQWLNEILKEQFSKIMLSERNIENERERKQQPRAYV